MVHYPASDNAGELMSVSYYLTVYCISHWFLYRPTLSYQRLQTVQPLSDEELYDRIRRTVPNKHELQVLESFLIFNKYASFNLL